MESLNNKDPRYKDYLNQYIQRLINGESGMRAFIPAIYHGQDIRLLLSKDNPIHLGWWFYGNNGHERLHIGELAEMGYSAKDINNIPIGYFCHETL